jgi:hypothetical protein
MNPNQSQSMSRLYRFLAFLAGIVGVTIFAVFVALNAPKQPTSVGADEPITDTPLVVVTPPDVTLPPELKLYNTLIVGKVEGLTTAYLGDLLGFKPFRTDWKWEIASVTPGLKVLPPSSNYPDTFIIQVLELGTNEIVFVSEGAPCGTPNAPADPVAPCTPEAVHVVYRISVEPTPVVIFSTPMPTYTPSPVPTDDVIVQADENVTITVLVGQSIAVLPPHGSGGSLYNVSSFDSDILAPISAPEELLASGEQIWEFRAVAPGNGVIWIEQYSQYLCPEAIRATTEASLITPGTAQPYLCLTITPMPPPLHYRIDVEVIAPSETPAP